MTSDQSWWLTMPPAELAARILPWFPSRKTLIEERVMTSIVTWLKTGSGREARSHAEHDSAPFKDPDVRAVAEAHNSLPASIVVTTTLTDLEAATGKGLTGGAPYCP
jgi:hypothetical protein